MRRVEDDDETPLPGDLDAEEESPYLRRQKAVAVRRRRFAGRARWTLFGISGLLFLGVLGYYLGSFARTSPRFVLSSASDILVDGNQFVSREEVLAAVGLPAKGSRPATIFAMSLADIRRQVEAIPWVRSATLTRAYPHRLAVHVEERVPVAFVSAGGRLKVVDGDGIYLEKPEKAVFDFPVLTGLDSASGLAERKQRLALYQDFQKQVATEVGPSGWLVSEVNLADSDDVRALLVQGSETIQVHFGDKDFLARFRSFLALLPEIRKSNARVDSVDLRYHNQIVVNPQKNSEK